MWIYANYAAYRSRGAVLFWIQHRLRLVLYPELDRTPRAVCLEYRLEASILTV